MGGAAGQALQEFLLAQQAQQQQAMSTPPGQEISNPAEQMPNPPGVSDQNPEWEKIRRLFNEAINNLEVPSQPSETDEWGRPYPHNYDSLGRYIGPSTYNPK